MPSRGNIYQKLILAAQHKLGVQGTLPDSLAELAEMAEIDEAEVLNIFNSIDDLREGLIYQGVVLLNDELRHGVLDSGIEKPDAQLRSLGHSYTEWAIGNPALFGLIVEGLNRPMAPDSTLHRYTTSMRDLFHRKLVEMRDLGLLRPDSDIDAILILLHCLIKGANTVFVSRASDPWIKDDPRPTQRIATDMFNHFLDMVMAANAPPANKVRSPADLVRS